MGGRSNANTAGPACNLARGRTELAARAPGSHALLNPWPRPWARTNQSAQQAQNRQRDKKRHMVPDGEILPDRQVVGHEHDEKYNVPDRGHFGPHNSAEKTKNENCNEPDHGPRHSAGDQSEHARPPRTQFEADSIAFWTLRKTVAGAKSSNHEGSAGAQSDRAERQHHKPAIDRQKAGSAAAGRAAASFKGFRRDHRAIYGHSCLPSRALGKTKSAGIGSTFFRVQAGHFHSP